MKRQKPTRNEKPLFLRTSQNSLPYGPTWPRHSHPDFWQLLLVIEGAMRTSTRKKESKGVVGSIFIRPPGTPHQEWCISAIDLKLHILLWTYPPGAKVIPLPEEAFDTTGHISNALFWLDDWQHLIGPRHAMLDSLLELILFACVQPVGPPQNQRFVEVLSYIRQNLAKPLTPRELARIASMSESHFSFEFRRQTGFSPMAYIRKARLDHACKAILQTDTVFREIAREAGFRDEFEFSRVFRRLMGVSPSSLRTRDRLTPAQE